MQNTFSSILNRVIESGVQSKNSIILNSKIDRSTFFQILSGKRLPTEKQYGKLLSAISPDDTLIKELDFAYISEKYGSSFINTYQFVLRLFSILKQHSFPPEYPSAVFSKNSAPLEPFESGVALRSSEEITNCIRHILLNEIKTETLDKTETSYIDIFAPTQALSDLGLFDMIKIIDINNKNNISFRHLASFWNWNITRSHEAFIGFSQFLSLITSINLSYNIYSFDSKCSDFLSGTILPYYIIFPNGVLFFNQNYSSGFYSRNENLLSFFKSEYQKIIDSLTPMIVSAEQFKDFIPLLSSLPDKTKTWHIANKPGLAYISNDYFLKQYVPDKETRERFSSYSTAYQHTDYKEFNSESGLLDMIKNGNMIELSYHVDISDDDLDKMASILSERLDKNLFMINTDKLPLSENWSVYVVEDTLILMTPLTKGKKAIYVTEKTIVQAFTEFCTIMEKGFLLRDSSSVKSKL